MTSSTIPELTVRREITVAASQIHAFDVFTRQFNSWWPNAHHIGAVDMAEAIMEPRTGRRWYERGVDGSECEWGKVLAWDPPRRVMLEWRLSGEFKVEADCARCSEVDVTFAPLGPESTHVELVHRHLERHTLGQQLYTGVSADGGWGSLLGLFKGVVERRG